MVPSPPHGAAGTNATLTFRGLQNLQTALDFAFGAEGGLTTATEVVISGSSAGGFAFAVVSAAMFLVDVVALNHAPSAYVGGGMRAVQTRARLLPALKVACGRFNTTPLGLRLRLQIRSNYIVATPKVEHVPPH